MENKEWWKSKTIWINVGAFILTFVPMIQEHISGGGTVTVLAVLNILLRAITKTAISSVITPKEKKDEA